MTEVLEGYCAMNLRTNSSRSIWVGVVQGDIYCKKRRYSVDKALQDAEKLFNKRIK